MRDVHFHDLPAELQAVLLGTGPVLVSGDAGPVLVEYLNTVHRRMAAGLNLHIKSLQAPPVSTGPGNAPGALVDLVHVMGVEAWLRMMEAADGSQGRP